MSALTAQDVRALKNADAIVYHYRDGEGFIRAILHAEHSSTGFEQEHKILAHSSRLNDYGKHDVEVRTYDAAHVITSAKYDNLTQTVVRHLRVGTSFVLEWVRDNSSSVTKEIGFVRDELRIRIGREGKAADTFLLNVYCGYDNTARLVRRTWATA